MLCTETTPKRITNKKKLENNVKTWNKAKTLHQIPKENEHSKNNWWVDSIALQHKEHIDTKENPRWSKLVRDNAFVSPWGTCSSLHIWLTNIYHPNIIIRTIQSIYHHLKIVSAKNNQFGDHLVTHMHKTNGQFITKLLVGTKTVDWFNTHGWLNNLHIEWFYCRYDL